MQLVRKLLFPFGIFYWIITYLRNVFYDIGIFKSYKIPVKSIVVGNLSVGGTGKTPHIEYLIRLLQNKKIATLSRGYGRKTKGFILANEQVKPTEIGDEPFQFFTKFKNISVAVDGNRTNGVQQLMQLVQPEIILLDDAYQHRKVTAGFTVLLTDYSNLFSEDYILPFGDLREPSFGKKRANVIIVTKCPHDISEIAQQNIIKKLKVSVPVFFSHIVYDEQIYNGESAVTISAVNEPKLIVAGIAKPKSFVDFLKKENDEVMLFPDHHEFSESEIENIITKANGKKIITTEKDFMRLKGKISKEYLYYLPIKVAINNKQEFDKKILEYVG
ncbi:tetraacyldisaccharide 4'-kinase [Flavobacterium haoranii]|uniref:Tetraacyldisaccharide 4'-kinase n=1 Tax=Flavobacterium haoranii TaxID=683124 RepID=A0A1M6IPE1_9FLAO|nr:tetraacyldisaccharide 4'-kinase [Flavobacterium haoranii]SHJ36303.1 lipid-A-disaccharide kinase [Flavobacterium haoranii]